MVVEKEGFGAFKNNNINMLLFSCYCYRLYNISLHACSTRRMFI